MKSRILAMSQNRSREFENKEIREITKLNEARRIGRWFYSNEAEQLDRRSAFLKAATGKKKTKR